MLKKVIVLFGVLFLLFSPSFASNDTDQIYVIPQVALILPKNSSIQSFWLVNPQSYSAKHKVEFCVTNQAIIGYMDKFLFFLCITFQMDTHSVLNWTPKLLG